MSFKLKKLNHTPEWYATRCRNENAPVSIHTMLKTDMNFIGADYDKGMIDLERIEVYRERWNAIMNGAENLHEPGGRVYRAGSDALKSEMMNVVEREAMAGFRPSDQFKVEPFKTIDALMTEAEIDANTMREFLRWRSRRKPIDEPPVVEVRDKEPASKTEMRELLKKRAKLGNRFFE